MVEALAVNEHGQSGVRQNTKRLAAQKEPGNAAAAVRPHDNEIAIARLGFLNDAFRRMNQSAMAMNRTPSPKENVGNKDRERERAVSHDDLCVLAMANAGAVSLSNRTACRGSAS